MNVELPSTGCNIINSATSFYNYTNSGRTRSLYYIYDGKAIKASESTAVNPYTYTGTCLNTGDLVYKPEYKEVLFPFMACVASIFIFFVIYHIIIKRLLP